MDSETTALVLEVWRSAGRRLWFARNAAFDAELRLRLETPHLAAAAGRGWSVKALGTAEDALALILLLDQVPRNIYRDTAHAFATDPLARRAADVAVAGGLASRVTLELEPFFYMPYVHAEDADAQARGVALLAALAARGGPADYVRSARLHEETIRRFGRFPHRNAVLGRISTPEETAFLASRAPSEETAGAREPGGGEPEG